jgi:SPFH domain / Band 7 family
MKQLFAIGAIVVAALVAWAASAALYTVSEVQQAIVVRLGKPVAVETEPAIKVKLPFADDVIFYDARLLTVELPLEETILGDQKRIQEQVYAGFRITDPLQFYLSLRTMAQAQVQLIQLIGSSVRRELGQAPLGALLSHDRDRISDDIRTDVAEKTKSLGIEISEIRFHRADLLIETSQAIYDRMKSERLREAKELPRRGTNGPRKSRPRRIASAPFCCLRHNARRASRAARPTPKPTPCLPPPTARTRHSTSSTARCRAISGPWPMRTGCLFCRPTRGFSAVSKRALPRRKNETTRFARPVLGCVSRRRRFGFSASAAAESLGDCVREDQWRKSAHFGTSFAPRPQGSMGTLEVEFFGEPSTSLSL